LDQGLGDTLAARCRRNRGQVQNRRIRGPISILDTPDADYFIAMIGDEELAIEQSGRQCQFRPNALLILTGGIIERLDEQADRRLMGRLVPVEQFFNPRFVFHFIRY
jgi:hypothetical protein